MGEPGRTPSEADPRLQPRGKDDHRGVEVSDARLPRKPTADVGADLDRMVHIDAGDDVFAFCHDAARLRRDETPTPRRHRAP